MTLWHITYFTYFIGYLPHWKTSPEGHKLFLILICSLLHPLHTEKHLVYDGPSILLDGRMHYTLLQQLHWTSRCNQLPRWDYSNNAWDQLCFLVLATTEHTRTGRWLTLDSKKLKRIKPQFGFWGETAKERLQTERERPGTARPLWGDSMEAAWGCGVEFQSDDAGQDTQKAVWDYAKPCMSFYTTQILLCIL